MDELDGKSTGARTRRLFSSWLRGRGFAVVASRLLLLQQTTSNIEYSNTTDAPPLQRQQASVDSCFAGPHYSGARH